MLDFSILRLLDILDADEDFRADVMAASQEDDMWIAFTTEQSHMEKIKAGYTSVAPQDWECRKPTKWQLICERN